MYRIEKPFIAMLQTKIRNKETQKDELIETLFKIGKYMGTEIIGNEFVTEEQIITPLDQQYTGLRILQPRVLVISTKDDYEYFAAGISDELGDCLRGYMDFAGDRGPEALRNKTRSIVLPDEKRGEIIETVIIAKAVLATGCTAISLLRRTVEKYDPDKIIIASIFYSEQGIKDLLAEMRRCKIYVIGQPDTLNQNGWLEPGVGNLDFRIIQ